MAVAVRIAVLLLLAIDWYEDTHHGRYAHSRPLTSTAVAPSLTTARRTNPSSSTGPELAAAGPCAVPALDAVPDVFVSGPSAAGCRASPATAGRIYVLMSLRC